MIDEIPQHPKQRQFDLIFGFVFLCYGAYFTYNLFSGVTYTKLGILMGVFTFILGIFKIYAYFKTKPVENKAK